MAHSNAFTLKGSGLNEFLFADVGTELNGSVLTVLSILARLGQDPWAEAARWAGMPKAAIIDSLAHSIAQMPLGPQALADARATAARLTLLLPAQVATTTQSADTSTMPKWLPIAILCGSLAFGLLVNLMLTPKPADPVLTSTTQTVDPHFDK